MEHLIEAGSNGVTHPSDEAKAFVEMVATRLEQSLSVGQRKFGLMPYRHNREYVGFDWIDEAKNSFGIVFYVAPHAGTLPVDMDASGGDVAVQSWVDMLLLMRLIAERVNGNSKGEL
jgi:hypothetical protein